eukprot:CAMPEP_0170582074 /NCGR_PEP_ID=MMETSP0224-20130122/7384_1 /TAXON_ID=285029 /ORGANISM="Togula jolla, Strain CCCM 725" /LENGTH=152 /DNA_ID=CAMNT_0010905263 /DNA_START=62 /DNA_END=520 /DNA_ORIENTATION=-
MAEQAQGTKLTQREMLELLSPPAFDQRSIVPPDATIITAPDHRWWRSPSPDRGEEFPDEPPEPRDPAKSSTRGTLGHDRPRGYATHYQTGSGTAPHFEDSVEHKSISGYSGFIPGKYAGNVVGGTYTKSINDAKKHLRTTQQAVKVNPGPPP